jgi:hypothetical protein
MTLRRAISEGLRAALVAEVPNIRPRDVTPSSSLYDKPRTPRGTSPAHFELAMTVATLRRLVLAVSDGTLGRLAAPAAYTRIRVDELDLVWDTFGGLKTHLTALAAVRLRALALRTGALAAGLGATASARTPLDPADPAERDRLVRAIERRLRTIVGDASRLTNADSKKVREAKTLGALVPVIAKKLETYVAG